jgi:hypothetical protein
MILAITICATSSYTYAMAAQARRVAANVRLAGIEPGHIIIVGDGVVDRKGEVEPAPALQRIRSAYESVMPPDWKITLICNPGFREHQGENYKTQAQLLIAAMREDAFTAARKFGADYCWSLDSDVLPPANALRCSLDTLRFDDGFYAIAQCPYPNALWLGGRGSYTHPIGEDFLPHERKVPWKLTRALAACEKRLAADPANEREQKRLQRLRDRLKACPPDGNVWEVTAKHGWRKRGWLDFAYPGIGRGAILPSDWCGFGCTLINCRALELADFIGYDGGGTEDLFVVWRRWAPAGLRIAVVTHCPCSHVIWQRKKVAPDKITATELREAESRYVLLDAYHEPEGECVGHLRYREMPWIPEQVDPPPVRDGRLPAHPHR